jgi:hypothetical protein
MSVKKNVAKFATALLGYYRFHTAVIPAFSARNQWGFPKPIENRSERFTHLFWLFFLTTGRPMWYKQNV